MSKNWSSFNEQKQVTDAWRKFLTESQINEEEIDESLWSQLTGKGSGEKGGLADMEREDREKAAKAADDAAMAKIKTDRQSGEKAMATHTGAPTGGADSAKFTKVHAGQIASALQARLSPEGHKHIGAIMQRVNVAMGDPLEEAATMMGNVARSAPPRAPRQVGGTSQTIDLSDIEGLSAEDVRVVNTVLSQALKSMAPGLQITMPKPGAGVATAAAEEVNSVAELVRFFRSADLSKAASKLNPREVSKVANLIQQLVGALGAPGNQLSGSLNTMLQRLEPLLSPEEERPDPGYEAELPPMGPGAVGPDGRGTLPKPKGSISESQKQELVKILTEELKKNKKFQRALNEKKRSKKTN